MMLLLLLSIPAMASGLISLSRKRRVMEWIHASASLGALTVGGVLAVGIRDGASVSSWDILRADALSAFMIMIVAFVGAVAGIYAIGYTRLEFDDGHIARVRLFYALFQLFVFTMLLAVTTDNLGVMWVAIEGTTLATVFLVNIHDNHTGLEAAYKYLIISSVGIALAFMGTVLMYYTATAQVGEIALSWTSLIGIASRLDPKIVKLAFVFILIGYGTKAGLAPMHTWLPDAHSEAPAPISALMSGVLLAVALYAIVRWKVVVNARVGSGFADGLLIVLGTVSLAIAALSLVIQRHYKRLLAYSSIEHTGLVCLGLGLGPLGVFAAMLHLLNHSVAKSMMFFLSGRILDRYRTTELGRVSGLLSTMPVTGGLFAAGMIALIGLPPFGLFLSKFAVVRAGFAAGRPWLMAVVLGLLVIAFVALVAHLNRMLYGAPPDDVAVGETRLWGLVPLVLCVAILVVLGLTVPRPVDALLRRIVEIAAQ